jgi:hypothetical protein
MKRHWPLVLAVALLVATNVAWAYVVLNNAVTATYQQDEAERVRVSRDQLLVLSNALLKDINLEQLRELARERLDSGTFIQEEDHRLFIDDLVFTFEHGRLVHVGDANETESVARDASD